MKEKSSSNRIKGDFRRSTLNSRRPMNTSSSLMRDLVDIIGTGRREKFVCARVDFTIPIPSLSICSIAYIYVYLSHHQAWWEENWLKSNPMRDELKNALICSSNSNKFRIIFVLRANLMPIFSAYNRNFPPDFHFETAKQKKNRVKEDATYAGIGLQRTSSVSLLKKQQQRISMKFSRHRNSRVFRSKPKVLSSRLTPEWVRRNTRE